VRSKNHDFIRVSCCESTI